MNVESSWRRKLTFGIGVLTGSLLAFAPGVAAAVAMLVYNSGDGVLTSPGRYDPLTTNLLAPNFPSDDYQCGGGTLETLHLFIDRADLAAAESPGNSCTSAGFGDAVCGFDLTLSVSNVSNAEEDRFWVYAFTPDSPSIVGVVSGDNKNTLRINGVNSAGWSSFPLAVGDVQLKRGSIESPVDTCPSACDLDWCASLSVDSAKIVESTLALQELSDTVPLLRLPEPSGNLLCGAGAVLVLGLAGRQRRVGRAGG